MFVPVGFMGGIIGHALPAVRDHDRDLGAPVGVQRADAVAGALGAAAEAADGQEDAADAVLPRVQQGRSARAPNAYVGFAGFLVRKLVRERRPHRRPRSFLTIAARRAHPGGLRARGGPGLPPRQRHAARRLVARSGPTR
ncbi:MAG: hypothetical protein MZU97_09440 [Bacillus subtilis]|nr:hypothetical protein [Bacillus subtilis]